jgi:ABC-2 type transport system ATP-binding protein
MVDTVLEARGVSYRYGSALALDRVDLRVGAGECVALLGPNGAGKTTLVSLAVGLLARQQGGILIAGGDCRIAANRRQVGVVQQLVGFPSTLKVRELVVGAAIRGGRAGSAAGPVLAELALTDLAGQRATKLSGGQRRRVQLAMALVTDPALLVLDEPTAELDVSARRRLWRVIADRRARGTGVLVTTHLIEESATVADRVVVLDHGRVLADTAPEALTARLPDRTVDARTRLAADRLRSLPEVLSMTVREDRVRLRTREPERLLRVLLAEDPELDQLRVTDAGLEEAVLSLIEPEKERTP